MALDELPPRDARIVFDLIDDAVADLLYYDRKEDADFSVEDIHRAFHHGVVTIEQATACFREALTEYLEGFDMAFDARTAKMSTLPIQEEPY